MYNVTTQNGKVTYHLVKGDKLKLKSPYQGWWFLWHVNKDIYFFTRTPNATDWEVMIRQEDLADKIKEVDNEDIPKNWK